MLISPIFFFNDTATTEIYTLSLHDALPIYHRARRGGRRRAPDGDGVAPGRSLPRAAHRLREQNGPRRRRLRNVRSEEHTSELQSPCNLVCRLLLEKKKYHFAVPFR